MSSAVELALMVGPLAIYLYVIALWQSGRRPRVVRGPLDFGLLLFGVSGLVLFGPVGQLVIARTGSGASALLAWLMLACAMGLIATPWLPRAFRRVLVYNVSSEMLARALAESLEELPGHFERTLRGYEDRQQDHGLIVEYLPWFRSADIEAFGADAEGLINQVAKGLQAHLREPTERPSRVAWALLGCCLALIMPVLGILLTRPQAHAVWRALMQTLRGG